MMVRGGETNMMAHSIVTFPHRRAMMAIAVVCGFGLSGCAQDKDYGGPQVAGWALVDPAQRYPIEVSQVPHQMRVRVGRRAGGLSADQRSRVLRFANKARLSDAGNSRIVVSAPSGSGNELASMHAVGEIRQIFGEYGFADSLVAVEAYRAGGQGRAPITISYLKFVAKGPDCGTWPSNVAREPLNVPYPNFGCSSQNNLAAMVANPSDLLGPRTETDRVGERRDAAWDNFIIGRSTVTEKNTDERITSSSGN